MIKGMNHVGISVSNLDRSIEFYQDMFGMTLVFSGAFGGELYETILKLKGAKGRIASLKLADAKLELFEFSHPDPKAANFDRPVCDHGITHFCLEVTDIESEYQRLVAAGVYFHCLPIVAGPFKATYGRDPDGNVFELLEIQPPLAT